MTIDLDADRPAVAPAPDAGSVPAPAAPRRARRLRLPRAGETIAGLILLVLLLAVFVPQLFTHADPLAIAPADAFQAPSAAHLFGTDESGRDVYTRVIYGARPSLLIGFSATAIGMVLAVVLGGLAALGGRAADFTVNRFLEVMFAFPGLLLALVFIAIFGAGVVTSTIAVGLATAPGYARILRTQILSVRRSGYVEASRVLGRSPATILRRTILPNVLTSVFVLATLGIGQAIVWASSLSFLGLGSVPPAAEWGAMLAAGRTYIGNAWWLTVFPGIAIVLSAASATVLGHALQKRVREARP
ncbi:ABC transporter permease [Leifsonia aquatica]|uniref:Peptide/nickel transport system permease protein n=2 Tax=Leifsonia aquatica TaxID=144185 RepID=A0A7W4YJA3_LEIAQ|nr:ABC transporter permease [Leifsonia aquatica]MBB2967881.1 peptide/nickel transport system permease protein [Leifsonia aquatica]